MHCIDRQTQRAKEGEGAAGKKEWKKEEEDKKTKDRKQE